MTAPYTPPAPPSLWATNMVELGIDPHITYTGHDGTRHPISGPFAPILGAEPGVQMVQIYGLEAPIKHLDTQGAREDGTTWNDSVRDAAEIDIQATFSAATPAEFRRVKRRWFDAWDPKKLGRLSWFTPEVGEWWCYVRKFKEITDQEKFSPATQCSATYQWSARNDAAFWQSVDSTSDTGTPGASGSPPPTAWSGFLPLANRGTEDAWPRYLVTGPGSFSFGDIGGKTITFGPLLPGQRVLITTNPRFPSVVDVSEHAPTAQQLNEFQQLMKGIVDLATNNNTPPLLQQFESWFGILPPQGALYSLLQGRFTTPVAGMSQLNGPTQVHIPVSWTAGDTNTRVVAALTPLRAWPE